MTEHRPDRIGPYVLGDLLGKGGMGEVYLARDTTLDRQVAIKILPARLREDPEHLRRLTREAKMLASLNHPHIATIHGLESHGGEHALVLELVSGPTLAELIDEHAPAGLPAPMAIDIARQIADALDAAHQHGVIHRDLKPANIKVAAGGRVKVLDFGLAKDITGSKDTTFTVVDEGTVAGTAAYMSPEQARGHPLDKRSDIWSFGCVLFEMLTGRPAFGRETISDTISSVLNDEPDWGALPPSTPDHLRRLLQRCLTKDLQRRLRDIGDAAFEFDPIPKTADPVKSIGASRLPWIAAVAVAASLAIGAWIVTRGVAAPALPSFQIDVDVLPTQAPWSGVAVSPSGREVAIGTFGPGVSVSIYSLATGERRLIPGGGAAPFWSPDGTTLGFIAPEELRRVDLRGGPPVKICEARLVRGATWNADDVIVFSSEGRLFRVPASGGTPAALHLDDPPGVRVQRTFPQFLPDNNHFLFHQDTAEGGAVFAGSLDSAETVRVLESPVAASVAPPDHLLFVRGTALFAQEFDVERLRLSGAPSVIAPDVAPAFLAGRASFWASPSGVLAYVLPREGTTGQLTWFDGNGRAAGVVEQPSGTEYLNPAFSPDGTRLAVNRMDPDNGKWDVWVLDLQRDLASRVTFGSGMNSDAVWSADGKEIVYAAVQGDRAGLYRKPADASTAVELLFETDSGETLVPSDWSSDGRYVIYSHSRTAPAGWRISVLPLFGERKPLQLFPPDPFQYYSGRLSGDGKWLAYAGTGTGQYELYVRPFMSEGAPIQVTRDGGIHPRWTGDSRELRFWKQPGGIYSAPVTETGGALRIGTPRPVVETRVAELIDGRPHYDATRDGKRFLLRQAVSRRPPVRVITSWRERLGR